MSTILVTGAAGFIGFHLSRQLLTRGEDVVGLDNLNDYYDVNLKLDRLKLLENEDKFRFTRMDLSDRSGMRHLFEKERFDYVVNLAAQAGVRHSITDPYPYIESNIMGFINVLEGCRHYGIKHLVFASSSSVYGANTLMPFSAHDNVDHPVSLYAATKKANELMAHAYSSLYRLPCTGLRFFTVYGPWGRPDMALFLFTKAIKEGEPINVFNYGKMKRDFTYVDDIVKGVVELIGHLPHPNPEWSGDNPDPSSSFAPYRLYNIGNNNPVELETFIAVLEKCLGQSAIKKLLPIQPGDVPATYADIDDLEKAIGFRPSTPIEQGIGRFVEWYNEYFYGSSRFCMTAEMSK